jgi:hypothetical protein
MNTTDEQPESEEPSPAEEVPAGEVIFPEDTVLPEDFTPIGSGTSRLPRSRRRRAHRMLVPSDASERAALLEGLARRATPSFEFFFFALFCGVVLGAAYLLDSPAFLLLGIVLAPLLTPWAGLALSIRTGSWGFFLMSLGALLVAGLLVFFTGALAGLAGQFWMPLRLHYADVHSHLWWTDLVIVALGAILLPVSFIRSEQRPVLSSILLAYGIFLPLSAAGVGLGLGVQPLWPNGLLVSLAHLALSVLVGALTLAALRFKPRKAGGHLLSILVGLLCLAALVQITGLTTVIRDGILATRRSFAPSPTTLVLPSRTPTTPPVSTLTPTPQPSSTPVPSSTPTVIVILPEPTPAYAVISAPEQYGGAVVRTAPAVGVGIAVLSNGSLVQVLPETQEVSGTVWAHILMEDGMEGWVLQDVLSPTTQTFLPTSTPTSASIP